MSLHRNRGNDSEGSCLHVGYIWFDARGQRPFEIPTEYIPVSFN